jgi:NAD(P)-dependent dehydrogenase (short-subunit alcohol dehydrogenase family)
MNRQERADSGIVVTGGGTGIGRAIALGAAETGARVVIAGRRPEPLDEVAQAAVATPGEISAVSADVAEDAQVSDLFEEAGRRLGRITGLVNAAGTLSVAPSAELSVAEFQRILDVNLTGAFRVSRVAASHMASAGGGSIVHIASLTSFGAFPRRLAYGVSKAGVVALVKTLAVEWARLGIRVNALAPGFVRTPISDSLVERGVLDLDQLEARTPLGRRAEPSEIVGPALFLLSDAAAFVTGECLVADGGWRAWVGPVEELAKTSEGGSGEAL